MTLEEAQIELVKAEEEHAKRVAEAAQLEVEAERLQARLEDIGKSLSVLRGYRGEIAGAVHRMVSLKARVAEGDVLTVRARHVNIATLPYPWFEHVVVSNGAKRAKIRRVGGVNHENLPSKYVEVHPDDMHLLKCFGSAK